MAEFHRPSYPSLAYDNATLHEPTSHLIGGGGDDTSGGMEARVTRLEERAALADERAGKIDQKLDAIIKDLGRIPSREALFGYTATVFATAVAIVAVLASAMGWLETRAARVQTPTPQAVAPNIIYVQPPLPTTRKP